MCTDYCLFKNIKLEIRRWIVGFQLSVLKKTTDTTSSGWIPVKLLPLSEALFHKCSKKRKANLRKVVNCCIFRTAFGCCASQTLVTIFIFSILFKKAEKRKKVKNLLQNLAKKPFFFLSFHQNAESFIPNFNIQPAFLCKLIKPLFCKIVQQICYFFTYFLAFLTSIWGAQHPNAGQNIQQIILHSKWLAFSKYHSIILPSIGDPN